MNVGINGLGRIGKSLLLQSLESNRLNVKAINIPNFNLNTIKSYLVHDSVHKSSLNYDDVHIIKDDKILVKGKEINIIDKRNPDKNMWKMHDINYLFDTTGKFLTEEKAKEHNVPYFIMCAPPKDNVPQFIFNGNHNSYKGEKIISNSSCTTNALVPVLNLLNKEYNIVMSNFLTVHAATASQNVIDGVHLKNRSHRTILNNIIPHTTGASKSAIKVLPELENKIFGTSVRIPTSNVSMVDLNLKLSKDKSIDEILNFLRLSKIVEVNDDPHLVSSDFISTKNPSIIDSSACMKMGDSEYKLTIWYDNEWSYSAQALNLVDFIGKYNQK